MIAAAGLVGVAGFTGASVATADTDDRTEALGRFLGGGGGDVNLDEIVALAGANAAYPSGPELETAVIDATVLDAINAEIGFDLFSDNGAIALGVVNQYAAADAEGAQAASGAVNDQGAIEIGGSEEFPGNASVDLTGAFGGTLVDQVISELYLELGALSATAEWPVGGEPTGDYQIAAASLELASPAVEDITDLINTQVVPDVDEAVASLVGTDGLIDGALDALDGVPGLETEVAIDVDLPAALAPVLADSFGNEGVVINLAAGTVTVDLETILGEGSLNDLPPNTELLTDEVVAAITAGLTAALDDLSTELVETIETALRSATLTLAADASVLGLVNIDIDLTSTLGDIVAGTVNPADATIDIEVLGGPAVELPLGTLVNALAGPLNDVLFGEGELVSTLAGTVNAEVLTPTLTALSPVFDVVNDIVSIVVNVQEQPGDLPNHVSGTESFTQRALSLAVLPEEGALVELDFASATVRAADEDGTEVDGTEVDGTEVDGTEVDGTEVDGTEVDGTEVDGTEVDGTEVDGTEVDGSDDNGTAGGGGMLPRTGAEVMAWIAIALLLIGAGTAAVIIAKRRAASLS